MKVLGNFINAFRILILSVLALFATLAFIDWVMAFFSGLGGIAWAEGERFMTYSIIFLGLEAITRKK